MQPIDFSYVPILIGTVAVVVAATPERWIKSLFIGAIAAFPLALLTFEFFSIWASGGIYDAIMAAAFVVGMLLFLWCMPVLLGFAVAVGLKLGYSELRDRFGA